jgi:hypothetical protein
MLTFARFWRDAVAHNPAVLLWLLLWGINAGMNAQLGHEIGGGVGLSAMLYGAAFFGFAGLGAWASAQMPHAVGGERRLLAALVGLQLVLGQMAGWQSMGLTLSKGAGTLESKQEQRTTTHEALRAARAERAQIGIVRPVAAVQADEVYECEKKSRVYKDGVGPRCTAFRGELATAKRARDLEKKITDLTADLGKGSQITNANALYDVPLAMAAGMTQGWAWLTGAEKAHQVGPDDVRFFWLVFLVFALEFVATIGPGLFGLGSGVSPRTPGAGGGGGGRRPGDPVPAPGQPETLRTDPVAEMQQALRAVFGDRLLPAPERFVQLAAPANGMDYPHSGHTGAYASGPPITINLGGGFPSSAVTPAQEAAMPTAALPPAPGVSSSPVRPNSERHDLPALSADAPPVDRSAIRRELSPAEREAADVILAFRAACVLDTPGGIVSAHHLYARYQAWAGQRALSETPFLRLLDDVTGLVPVDIGGLGHFRGVALRMGASLEAVA